MKIGRLSTAFGVENYIEHHCIVRYIIVSSYVFQRYNAKTSTTKIVSLTICTRQLFISGFSQISLSNG